jgi:uncharacterized membrane protein
MKLDTYKKLRNLLLVIVLLLMGLAIYFEIVFLGIIAVGGGMVVNSFFKAQVKDKQVDERIAVVSDKAAMTSFKVSLSIVGFIGVVLLVFGQGSYYFLESMGIVLGFVTCVMVAVYLISWIYFNKYYGG